MRGLLLGLVGLSLIVALLGLGSAMTCGGQVSLSCLEATLSLVSPDFLWNFEAVRFTAEQGVLPEAVPHYDPFHGGASLRQMWHAPGYYYLAAGLGRVAGILGVPLLVSTALVSVLMIGLAKLFFLLLLRELGFRGQSAGDAALLFFFLPTHLYYTLFINGDPVFYFFLVASAWVFLRLITSGSWFEGTLLGLLLGAALLSHLSALLLIATYASYGGFRILQKAYREGGGVLLASLLGLLVGSYPLVKNLLKFGSLLGDTIPSPQTPWIIVRTFGAFWGGVFGGAPLLNPAIVIFSLLLTGLAIFGIFLWWKNEDRRPLLFLSLLALMVTLMMVVFVCNPEPSLHEGSCIGKDVHARFLIPFELLLAIFPAYAARRIQQQSLKRMVRLVFVGASAMFLADFWWALL